MKLLELLKQIRSESNYPKEGDWSLQDVYETYALLSEFLDSTNAYEYNQSGKTTWSYKDALNNEFYIKLAYIPGLQQNDVGYLELKTFWTDESDIPQYTDFNGNTTNKDLQKRSDTVAKVYHDEVIPFFQSQNLTKELRIIPVNDVRYRLSQMMVKKYTPEDYRIQYFKNYISISKS